MDRTTILARHEELKAIRLPEERAWQTIASLLMPEEAQFAGLKTEASYDQIFDSTPLYAHDDFVAGLFSQATNPANQWFSLSLPDQDLAAWKPAKDWLWATASVIAYSLTPAVSPFYSEAPAWFADTGAFGNGGMFSDELVGRGRIVDRAIPLRELYIDRDASGDLDTVHREFRLPQRRAAEAFGEMPGIAATSPSEITLIHAVFPNPEHDPAKKQSKPFLSVYLSPDVPALFQLKGYWEMPYFMIGWARGVNRVWRRGPGHRARADMATLNKMEELHIVAANWAADPPWALHQDIDLTAADIYPGALLYGAMSEQGKELARTLSRGQNLQLSIQQSEQRRKAIRDAFYFSLMQVVNRPQMTATEILGYREETLRQMAPNLSLIQHSGLSPLIARRYAMLERMGALPPPPPDLAGRALTINYVSPLALAQKASQGRAVLQLFQAAAQMAQFRPEVMDNFDPDAAMQVLHDAYGPPPAVLRDPSKVDAERQGRVAAQQRQTDLADAAQQVQIAATASHAAQAATLSGQRRMG